MPNNPDRTALPCNIINAGDSGDWVKIKRIALLYLFVQVDTSAALLETTIQHQLEHGAAPVRGSLSACQADEPSVRVIQSVKNVTLLTSGTVDKGVPSVAIYTRFYVVAFSE